MQSLPDVRQLVTLHFNPFQLGGEGGFKGLDPGKHRLILKCVTSLLLYVVTDQIAQFELNVL